MWDKIISRSYLIAKPRVQKGALKKAEQTSELGPTAHCTGGEYVASCLPNGSVPSDVSRCEFTPLSETDRFNKNCQNEREEERESVFQKHCTTYIHVMMLRYNVQN